METKHTPGPWFYGQNNFQPKGGEFFEIGLRPQCDLAGGGISGIREGEERYFSISGFCGEANARLIASAPELLEALQHFVSVCETGKPVDLVTLIGESCNKAKSAIAKAIGE